MHSPAPLCTSAACMASDITLLCAAVGLMCSGGAPAQDQQASLAAALQRSCVAFCTVCHAATAAAGPSLKASLGKLAHDVVTPCLALVKDMVSPEPQIHRHRHGVYLAQSCQSAHLSALLPPLPDRHQAPAQAHAPAELAGSTLLITCTGDALSVRHCLQMSCLAVE
jgi:hypothetical protein